MMQDSGGERDRVAAADAGVIEKGWSVFDSLDRPVGNVTDVEGGILRVDGRPQDLGFFEIPLQSIGSAGDGEVHLTIQMEEFGERPIPAAPPPTAAGAEEETTSRVRLAAADSPTTSRDDGERLTGSSYTASGTPVGLGSNTPVGDEPSSFRTWEEEEVPQESFWSRWGAWLTPAVVGVAGLLGYLWWRRRQERRGPLGRARGALETVGESVEPIWDAARERRRGLWLAPLAALPLILYLRWTRDESAPDAARERSPDREWLPDREAVKGRLQSMRLPERLQSARLPEQVTEDASAWWWAAIPAAVGVLGAMWYSTRRGKGSRGRSKRLGKVMTTDVQVVRPETTAFEAASMMRTLDVGVLPVCDGRRLRGMVTDRDLVVRAIADGRDPHLATVADVMSTDLVYATEDDSVGKAAKLMRQHQIRRLPIVDRDNNLVGIVSLGDLAVDAGDDALSGETLERVSAPSRPKR
jgi:CBS domain-containing protein